MTYEQALNVKESLAEFYEREIGTYRRIVIPKNLDNAFDFFIAYIGKDETDPRPYSKDNSFMVVGIPANKKNMILQSEFGMDFGTA